MSQTDEFLSGFLSFRRMLTPTIIQVLFYLGAGALALVGAIGVLTGLVGVAKGTYGAFGKMLFGAVVLLLGPLVVRIWCELVILAFRIHDTIVEIAHNTMSGP